MWLTHPTILHFDLSTGNFCCFELGLKTIVARNKNGGVAKLLSQNLMTFF